MNLTESNLALSSDVVFTPPGMMGCERRQSENQDGVRTGRVSGGIRQGLGSRPSAVCPEKLCLTQSVKDFGSEFVKNPT